MTHSWLVQLVVHLFHLEVFMAIGGAIRMTFKPGFQSALQDEYSDDNAHGHGV